VAIRGMAGAWHQFGTALTKRPLRIASTPRD
jgi:hypothetical protein